MSMRIGRHLLGLTAIGFGVVAFVWHGYNVWQSAEALGSPHALLYALAIIEIFGGLALQFERAAPAGALAVGTVYALYALLWIPAIVGQHLRTYGHIGSFFEQLSMVGGALIVYAASTKPKSEDNVIPARIGYWFFALSVISFTLEQAFYLQDTAAFVPKWIPPNQMFWAVLTTIAFALGAIALISGRSNLLAARLLVLMVVGFEFLIWLPSPLASPHDITAWDGNFENIGILAAAWIVMDYLRLRQEAPSRPKIALT